MSAVSASDVDTVKNQLIHFFGVGCKSLCEPGGRAYTPFQFEPDIATCRKCRRIAHVLTQIPVTEASLLQKGDYVRLSGHESSHWIKNIEVIGRICQISTCCGEYETPDGKLSVFLTEIYDPGVRHVDVPAMPEAPVPPDEPLPKWIKTAERILANDLLDKAKLTPDGKVMKYCAGCGVRYAEPTQYNADSACFACMDAAAARKYVDPDAERFKASLMRAPTYTEMWGKMAGGAWPNTRRA